MNFDLAVGLMAARPQHRVKYASLEQDPLRQAAAASSSRSRDRRRQLSLSYKHLQNVASALENGKLQLGAAALLNAHYLSEGFAELSELYCSLLLNRAQPITDMLRATSSQAHRGLHGMLACAVVALRAMLTTHWEEAAAFAEWSLRSLMTNARGWTSDLHALGLQVKHLQWTLHTVLGSVYSRLLQCANSSLRSAAAAHARQLEAHARAAHRLRHAAPRSPFELGWAAWSRGDHPAATVHFRQVLLLAAEADDDVFAAAGGWALACALTLGGGGLRVPAAQVCGLVAAAEAAERRLQGWGMVAAVKAIAAFAREPMRRVTLPEGLAFVAVPALRRLPLAKEAVAGPQRCDGCGGRFLHMLKCGGCRSVRYCSRECQVAAWPEHKAGCCASGRSSRRH